MGVILRFDGPGDRKGRGSGLGIGDAIVKRAGGNQASGGMLF